MATRKLKFKTPMRKKVPFREALRTIQARILADIKIIRLRWAEGRMDAEIREELNLGFREWARRIRIMRSVPADDDVIKSFRRYSLEHEKAVAKMQERLRDLNKIYEKSIEEITFTLDPKDGSKSKKKPITYSKPRDMHLASRVIKDMHEIDRDILKAEADFITMKQRLSIIEMPVPELFDPFASTETQLITAPNIVAAWRLRKEREEAKKLANAQDVTEAVVVDSKLNGKVNGNKKAKA